MHPQNQKKKYPCNLCTDFLDWALPVGNPINFDSPLRGIDLHPIPRQIFSLASLPSSDLFIVSFPWPPISIGVAFWTF
jgi:hypothetical protein